MGKWSCYNSFRYIKCYPPFSHNIIIINPTVDVFNNLTNGTTLSTIRHWGHVPVPCPSSVPVSPASEGQAVRGRNYSAVRFFLACSMHNVSTLQNVVFNLILQKWSFDPHRNYCFAGELTQLYLWYLRIFRDSNPFHQLGRGSLTSNPWQQCRKRRPWSWRSIPSIPILPLLEYNPPTPADGKGNASEKTFWEARGGA